MDAKIMQMALKALDQEVSRPLKLLIGGGAAFILAHDIPLLTNDIDGIPYQTELRAAELDPLIKKVAKKLKIPPDWLNHYFATYTYSLPKDYGSRLVTIYEGKNLKAVALGKEDLLIMKCFAGRDKDVAHARALLKKKVDTKLVAEHLHRCLEENIPKAKEACDFFYEICEQLGINL
ncbi:MAG: DUF6036 family nucleotidyltransferase [Deltaproteobacteria bacterium]|nr:DUF6036 family nucleotidyltransferase [Deltaproteobacteria bacterium]